MDITDTKKGVKAMAGPMGMAPEIRPNMSAAQLQAAVIKSVQSKMQMKASGGAGGLEKGAADELSRPNNANMQQALVQTAQAESEMPVLDESLLSMQQSGNEMQFGA